MWSTLKICSLVKELPDWITTRDSGFSKTKVEHSVIVLGYSEGCCIASGLSLGTSVIIVGIWESAGE